MREALWASRALRVTPASLELSVSLARRVRRVSRAAEAPLVLWDLWVLRVRRVSLANLVHLVPVVIADFRVLPVSWDLLVPRVCSVTPDPLAQPALKDARATRVRLVLLDLLVLMVNRDSMELPALVAYRERSDLLERRVIRALPVLRVLQVRLES